MRSTEFYFDFGPYEVRDIRVLSRVVVENPNRPNHNRSFDHEEVVLTGSTYGLHFIALTQVCSQHKIIINCSLRYGTLNFLSLQVLHPALLFLYTLRVGRSTFSGTTRLYILLRFATSQILERDKLDAKMSV
jgi:hypothetical protein